MPFIAGVRANRREGGEIRSLTGLRGCAALMVMLYHFSLNVPPDTLPLQGVLQKGYLFVDLFFVLSGFVMGYSQTRLFASGYRLRSHAYYLLSRVARIYPLYAVITIESFCLLAWRSADQDPSELARTLFLNLALVQAWGLAPSLEGAAWSISTEWAAYLLFPLLLIVSVLSSRRMATVTSLLSLLAIAVLALSPALVAFPGQSRMGPLDIYSSSTALPVLRCVAEFALGLVAFRVARDRANRLRPSAELLAAASLVSLGAMLMLPAADLAVVPLFAVLIVALSVQSGRVAGFLGMEAPYRLGQWSYSIYLIHDKFSHSVTAMRAWFWPRAPLASVTTVVLVGGLVVAAGAMIHFVVEVPLQKLVLGWVRRLIPVAAEPATIAAAPPEQGAKVLG